MLPLWARLDQGAMAMKGYSASPYLALILFRVISGHSLGILPLFRGAVGVFYTELNVKTVLIQIIQFSQSMQFTFQNKTILCQAVQFSISM